MYSILAETCGIVVYASYLGSVLEYGIGLPGFLLLYLLTMEIVHHNPHQIIDLLDLNLRCTETVYP